MSARQLDTTVVPFEAGDGRPLDLLHVTGRHAPVRGPVLLAHGAGVRADIFRPPPRTTLVDALVAGGWDVWLENWRASIDHVPCRWTLDQAAVHAHRARALLPGNELHSVLFLPNRGLLFIIFLDYAATDIGRYI